MSRHIRRKEISNLDSLLAYIYEEYIEIREEDFTLHYRVFDVIFQQLRKKMEEVDELYKRHTSTVDFMGSHYDRLRIKKPDEFDTFNIIKLPSAIVACPDFQIKAREAAFVYIKMGVKCRNVLMNGPNSDIDRKILTWIDSSGYLRRSCLFYWYKGVVDRALNEFKRNTNYAVFHVDGKQYTVIRSESGPAITLKIKSVNGKFNMDVDLVPALKFSEDLWPPGPGYVEIPPGCNKGHWMVVPKPNKYKKGVVKQRSWRIAMPQQERQMIHNSYNLRQAIRLVLY
ncbi:unnamed protein product [Diatraea saccharalis]|uniref:Mab-21-like nucleotidyltransferase domain-containing protein n=1 Tax=Diatraea saccharalis TaxID=40085 RepID=A0A9N9QX75_9NEOP|nr:unnamed protein product [Diatraea saccharalis]